MLRWTLLAGAASAFVAPVVPRPRSARAAAAVELADCPVTQWGASIPDILAAQRATRAAPEQPFLHGLEPPSSNPDDQLRWLADDSPVGERAIDAGGAVRRAAPDADPHDDRQVRGERLLFCLITFVF